MIELNGRRLGLDDELARDYGAFHDAAAAIDMSDRGRMRFTGAGARNALNGILTCDIAVTGVETRKPADRSGGRRASSWGNDSDRVCGLRSAETDEHTIATHRVGEPGDGQEDGQGRQ